SFATGPQRSRSLLFWEVRSNLRGASRRDTGVEPTLQFCPASLRPGAHLGTTTGSRLCPKDQPQQVRMPRVAELSEYAWPRRAAAAGAPHTAAVRSRAFGGGIKMRPLQFGMPLYDRAIISRHAGFRIETDPSPHPSPSEGTRRGEGARRAGEGRLTWPKIFARLYSAQRTRGTGRRFRKRDSVWTAATCRRFCPRAQAKPPRIGRCREQKRQQAGALQTLPRDSSACSHADRRASICNWALRHADIERRTPVRPVRSDCPGSRTTGSSRRALCPRSIFAK